MFCKLFNVVDMLLTGINLSDFKTHLKYGRHLEAEQGLYLKG